MSILKFGYDNGLSLFFFVGTKAVISMLITTSLLCD